MSNLELWDSVSDIDPAYTKPITGKDYSGTSPNPTYMIRLATEKFGSVGDGFGWEILDDGFKDFGDTTLHYCRVNFWWKGADGERKSFQNYGQTKAAYKTKGGYIKVDEDAPKKSMTDAIVKCLSHLGFASSIFLGLWDDSGYVIEVKDKFEREKDPEEFDRKKQKEAEQRAKAERKKS